MYRSWRCCLQRCCSRMRRRVREPGGRWCSRQAALAGVSVGLRTIGVAVVAGIFFLALRRRAFREAFLLAAVAGTVVAIESWSRLVHLIAGAGASPVATSAGEPGWNQVLAYYTDYVGFGWKMGIPSAWALVRFLETSIASLALAPGSIIVGVDQGRVAATALLSVLVWLGMLRQIKRPEWQATWYVLIPYCCIVAVWLPLPERFLLPFIPCVFCGTLAGSAKTLGDVPGQSSQRGAILAARAGSGVRVRFHICARIHRLELSDRRPPRVCRKGPAFRHTLSKKRNRRINGFATMPARTIALPPGRTA